MTNRHHLAVHQGADLLYERCDLIGPLRPRVDVATLAWTLPVTKQIDGEGAHVVHRHPSGEALIPARMLAKTVHDGEGDAPSGMWPRPISDLASSGRLYESVGNDGRLRCQGARSPSGS